MASMTIRNLDLPLKDRLRVRAARNGRSMEQEVRQILKTALDEEVAPTVHLADAIRALFEPFGGVDLEIPPRAMGRDPPDFAA